MGFQPHKERSRDIPEAVSSSTPSDGTAGREPLLALSRNNSRNNSSHGHAAPSPSSNQTEPLFNAHAQAFVPTRLPSGPAIYSSGSPTRPNYSQNARTYTLGTRRSGMQAEAPESTRVSHRPRRRSVEDLAMGLRQEEREVHSNQRGAPVSRHRRRPPIGALGAVGGSAGGRARLFGPSRQLHGFDRGLHNRSSSDHSVAHPTHNQSARQNHQTGLHPSYQQHPASLHPVDSNHRYGPSRGPFPSSSHRHQASTNTDRSGGNIAYNQIIEHDQLPVHPSGYRQDPPESNPYINNYDDRPPGAPPHHINNVVYPATRDAECHQAPTATVYDSTPYGGGTPYGSTPYGTLYGTPYGTPYGAPYGAPYGGAPYGATPYHGTPYDSSVYGGSDGSTPHGGTPYGTTPYTSTTRDQSEPIMGDNDSTYRSSRSPDPWDNRYRVSTNPRPRSPLPPYITNPYDDDAYHSHDLAPGHPPGTLASRHRPGTAEAAIARARANPYPLRPPSSTTYRWPPGPESPQTAAGRRAEMERQTARSTRPQPHPENRNALLSRQEAAMARFKTNQERANPDAREEGSSFDPSIRYIPFPRQPGWVEKDVDDSFYETAEFLAKNGDRWEDNGGGGSQMMRQMREREARRKEEETVDVVVDDEETLDSIAGDIVKNEKLEEEWKAETERSERKGKGKES